MTHSPGGRSISRRKLLLAAAGTVLDPARCGGDLVVQACANDPLVAFHAVRNLARLGTGVVTLRWMQLGFGHTSSTGSSQATPRNLMGFRDGTRNIRGDDEAATSAHVWVGAEEPQAWLRGASYLVARRIRMHVESWDREKLAEQQDVFGRYKTGRHVSLRDGREDDPMGHLARGGMPNPGSAPRCRSGWQRCLPGLEAR